MLFWAFKNRVATFQYQYFTSNYQLSRMSERNGHPQLELEKMARDIGWRLYLQGFIIEETYKDEQLGGVVNKLKVYCIK